MVKKGVMFLFAGVLLLLLLSGISAESLYEYKVAVKVIAGSGQNLIVRFKDYSTQEFFKSLQTTVDDTGFGRVVLETNHDEMSIDVYFVESLEDFLNPENILDIREFEGPFYADEPITIDAISIVQEEPEEVDGVNDSVVVDDTEEIVEEEETPVEDDAATITGNVVEGEEGGFFTSNAFYYILGIIGLAVVVFVIIFFVKKKGGASKEIKVKKLSDIKRESEDNSATNEAIADAQRKIAEAQADIRRLQNQDRIKEAEARVKKEQEALERLRSGQE